MSEENSKIVSSNNPYQFLSVEFSGEKKSLHIDAEIDNATDKVQLVNEFIDNLDLSLDEFNKFFSQFGLLRKTPDKIQGLDAYIDSSVLHGGDSCSGVCSDCDSTAACSNVANAMEAISPSTPAFSYASREDQIKKFVTLTYSKYFTKDGDFFSSVILKRRISVEGLQQAKIKFNGHGELRQVLSTCVNVAGEKQENFKGVNIVFALPLSFFVMNFSSMEKLKEQIEYLIGIKEVFQYWNIQSNGFGAPQIYDSVLQKKNTLFATLKNRQLIPRFGSYFSNDLIFNRANRVNQVIGAVMNFEESRFSPYI